jgi:hypothetical protein
LLHHAHVLTCGPRAGAPASRASEARHEPVGPARRALQSPQDRRSRVRPCLGIPQNSAFSAARTPRATTGALAPRGSDAVEPSCLGRSPHWPVFRCPRLAGFQVSTEGTRPST